ncbi:MAG: conjugal transfer protein TraD [Rhabdochlamydiaceae bacterium]|jgi:hypothetical protein
MKTQQIIEKEKLALKKAVLEKREKLLREKERKIRTRQLIRIGELALKAGIGEIHENILFGAFLEVKERSKNPSTLNKWDKDGTKALEVDKDHYPQQLAVSFKEESLEAKMLLKERQFRRNSFRKEWYGYGKKEELEELLKEYSATIEVIATQN